MQKEYLRYYLYNAKRTLKNSSILERLGSYDFGHSKDDKLRIFKLLPPLILAMVKGRGMEGQMKIQVVSYDEGGSWTRSHPCNMSFITSGYGIFVDDGRMY